MLFFSQLPISFDPSYFSALPIICKVGTDSYFYLVFKVKGNKNDCEDSTELIL